MNNEVCPKKLGMGCLLQINLDNYDNKLLVTVRLDGG